jgi:hypothetical protein
MAMTQRKPRLTYRQVLESVKALRPVEQRRLYAELAKRASVYILEPDDSPAAVRHGRRLAAQIRKQVGASMSGSLEDTMRRLRGRSWS